RSPMALTWSAGTKRNSASGSTNDRCAWSGGGGWDGLTRSEEGGLDEVEESLRRRAKSSCSCRTVCCSVATCACRAVTCCCKRWQLAQASLRWDLIVSHGTSRPRRGIPPMNGYVIDLSRRVGKICSVSLRMLVQLAQLIDRPSSTLGSKKISVPLPLARCQPRPSSPAAPLTRFPWSVHVHPQPRTRPPQDG